MNRNVAVIRNISGLGLVGALVLGAGSVTAEQFDASAAVNTAIAITQDTPLSFGNVFITAAGDRTINNWSQLILNPDTGATTVNNGSGTAPFVALGGATPAVATLAGVATAEITVSLPDGQVTPADPGTAFASTGTGVTLTIEGGDPGVATFELYDFTVGNEVGAGDATAGGGAGEFLLTRDFAATDITFSIGAKIVTDGSGNSYQDGNYVGTFDVEAAY